MSSLIIIVVILLLILLTTIIILLVKKDSSKRDEFKIINTVPSKTVPIRQNTSRPSSPPLLITSGFGYRHRGPGFGYRYPVYYYNDYPDYVYYDDCGECCDDCVDGKCEWDSTTGVRKKGTNQQCIKYKDCSDRKNGLNNKEKDVKCSKIAME